MKRFLIVAALLMFAGFTFAFAAEKPAATSPLSPRTPEMSTAGKVQEITGTLLKIERSLRGSAEVMEFILEKPLAGIEPGEQVKVSYRVKDGRNILIRVAPAPKTAVGGKAEGKPKPGTK
jgi:hypothetical protein